METQCRCTVRHWPLKPDPEQYLPRSFTNAAPVTGLWMEKLSVAIVPAATDKLLPDVQKLPAGPVLVEYTGR